MIILHLEDVDFLVYLTHQSCIEKTEKLQDRILRLNNKKDISDLKATFGIEDL